MIHSASMIIVGVEHSEETSWFLLHLHDCLNALSVRPNQEVVVIAQGQGRGRLQNTTIPFENIVRFEAFEVPVGHSCVSEPVNPEAVGEHQTIAESGLFIPIGIRLLIRGVRHEFFSVYDLGVTPLPILVPSLKELPRTAFGLSDINELRSADDCLALSNKVAKWVLRVNDSIRVARERREDELAYICRYLDLTKLTDRQVVVAAHEAMTLQIALVTGVIVSTAKARLRKARNLRLQHSFPLGSRVGEGDSTASQISVASLRMEVQRFHNEIGRPVSEALELVAEHVKDLQTMSLPMEDLDALLEELSSKPVSIIDPAKTISEKNSLLTDKGLWHETQIQKVYQDEKIDICYLKGLRFLSLLVEYDGENGEKGYFVVIKHGLPRPLTQFLLSHELGHFHLHVKSKLAEKFKQVDSYLRSSGKPNFLEDQADQFAMSLLFPPAYLADQETFRGELSAEWLCEDFLKDIQNKNIVSPRLRQAMLHHITCHISRYHEFKDSRKPSFLSIEVPSIEEDKVEALISILEVSDKDKYWVWLDEDSKINDASKNFAKLFDQTRESIKGMVPIELAAPEEVELMRRRAKERRDKKKHIYYFSKLKNGRHVIVYSFPILKNEEYVGAMGILKPIDEIESDSYLQDT